MSKTCENCLALVNSCVYYACQTRDIYQVLLYWVDFKAPGELWNLMSKAVLNKSGFIFDKIPLNILYDHKAQR